MGSSVVSEVGVRSALPSAETGSAASLELRIPDPGSGRRKAYLREELPKLGITTLDDLKDPDIVSRLSRRTSHDSSSPLETLGNTLLEMLEASGKSTNRVEMGVRVGQPVHFAKALVQFNILPDVMPASHLPIDEDGVPSLYLNPDVVSRERACQNLKETCWFNRSADVSPAIGSNKQLARVLYNLFRPEHIFSDEHTQRLLRGEKAALYVAIIRLKLKDTLGVYREDDIQVTTEENLQAALLARGVQGLDDLLPAIKRGALTLTTLAQCLQDLTDPANRQFKQLEQAASFEHVVEALVAFDVLPGLLKDGQAYLPDGSKSVHLNAKLVGTLYEWENLRRIFSQFPSLNALHDAPDAFYRLLDLEPGDPTALARELVAGELISPRAPAEHVFGDIKSDFYLNEGIVGIGPAYENRRRYYEQGGSTKPEAVEPATQDITENKLSDRNSEAVRAELRALLTELSITHLDELQQTVIEKNREQLFPLLEQLADATGLTDTMLRVNLEKMRSDKEGREYIAKACVLGKVFSAVRPGGKRIPPKERNRTSFYLNPEIVGEEQAHRNLQKALHEFGISSVPITLKQIPNGFFGLLGVKKGDRTALELAIKQRGLLGA